MALFATLSQAVDPARKPWMRWPTITRWCIRSTLLMAVVLLIVMTVEPSTSAHQPDDNQGQSWNPWSWPCYGGDRDAESAGYCWTHHSYANARLFRETSITGNAGWNADFWSGHNQWDQTNGHEFNFLIEVTDTSSKGNVRTVSGDPCGIAHAAGCADISRSGSYINESDAEIEFRANTSANRPALVAHELGHFMGFGHSAETHTTMTDQVNLASQHASNAYED